MVKLNYFNNTGGINRFSSDASLNESESRTDWWDAQNVECHKSGGISKMKGNTRKASLGSDVKILNICDYIKGGVHYPIINTSEGKLYRLNLDLLTYTEIYNGLCKTAKCNSANFNNGIILTNGVDTPLFYEEGVGITSLGGNPPKGQPIEIYKARVFIVSGSTLNYSALGNPNDWTTSDDAGFIANFHNDSSPIIALKNYGEFLAIYKRTGIYILSGSSPDDFIIKPIADKGSVSTWGIGNVDNNQYFFCGENITPLRFNELGQIRLDDDISIKIKPAFAELDNSKFDQILCIPYQKKNQIWFYFGSGLSTDLDICYIYDYFHKCWFKRSAIPVTCGVNINGSIYTGTSDGRILLEDNGDNFDGNPIKAWWYSPWFTFGNPGIPKEINEFNIWLYQDQKDPVEVLCAKDYLGLDQQYSMVNIASNSDLIWNSEEFGMWDSFCWSYSRAVKKRIQINGSCESLQIGVKNLSADQPFTIIGYSFEVELAEL